MTRLNILLAISLIAGCGPRDSSQVIFPPDGIALDSTGSAERHFLPDSLQLLAQLGGASERDTALFDPYMLEADGNHAYVVEGDQRIQAYDTMARLVWSVGRDGGGPGEFRNIRDLKIAPNREIWAHDPVNARITRIGTNGRVTGFIPVRVGHSESMAPTSNTTAVLQPRYDQADIVTIDTSGQVIDSDTVRWKGFQELEVLSKQFETANDPATGRWVLAFSFGNGWFAFEGHGGSERRFYVEPTAFPAVVKEVTNGGAAVSTKLVRGDLSAHAVALVGDTMFVLFGGKELSRQQLDLYSWTSGKYLGTIALPEPVDDFAITGRYLYTLGSHPVPKLAVYRRR